MKKAAVKRELLVFDHVPNLEKQSNILDDEQKTENLKMFHFSITYRKLLSA